MRALPDRRIGGRWRCAGDVVIVVIIIVVVVVVIVVIVVDRGERWERRGDFIVRQWRRLRAGRRWQPVHRRCLSRRLSGPHPVVRGQRVLHGGNVV
jgi:hypothetical protein